MKHLKNVFLATLMALGISAVVAYAADVAPAGPKITTTGGVDVYYLYDTSGADPAIVPVDHIFDVSNNTFRTSLAKYSIDVKEAKAGAHVDLIYGEAADLMYLGHIGTPGTAVGIESAYVTYTPTSKWAISAGKFATLIGYEVIESWANPNYSRSFAFGYTIPFEHTGVKATYSFNDKYNATAMVANTGWTDEASLNSDKTALVQFIANPTSKFGIVANVISGDETHSPVTRYKKQVGNFILNLNPSSKFYAGFDLTYGIQQYDGGGSTSSVNYDSEVLYLTYLLKPSIKTALRLEMINDKDGATALGVPKAREATYTLGYKVGGLNPRAEFRYDEFLDADGNKLGTQRTYVLGTAYTF